MGSASVPGAYSSLCHAHAYRPDQRALRSHWCVTTSRSHAKGPCRNDAKMSSALAKSSGAIWYSAAAAFSATCLGRVAPIIAEDTSCLRNTQASANWAKLTPASLSAISFTCCTAVNRGLAATVSAALRPLTHGRPGIPPATAL